MLQIFFAKKNGSRLSKNNNLVFLLKQKMNK